MEVAGAVAVYVQWWNESAQGEWVWRVCESVFQNALVGGEQLNASCAWFETDEVQDFLIPGPPFLAYTAYWEVDRRLIETDKTAFGRVARPFFFGDSDEFRNERFKFLPKVVEGNFAIKMAVKDTPVLMGKKLTQYYFRGDNYFEIDVDISSSSVARSVTGLVIGYARTLVIDMALCIEGTNEDELPEVVIGTCSAVNVDVLCAKEM